MLFNFQLEFAPYIVEGSKTHTIRAMRRDLRLPDPGDVAHCYTGLRTKRARLLGRWPVLGVDRIRIRVTRAGMAIGLSRDGASPSLTGWELPDDEANAFAWRDGFRALGTTARRPGDALGMMREFWIRKHGPAARNFQGFVTHWNFNKPAKDRA